MSENKICPVNYAVNLLSGKYKLRILHALLQESPKRFKVLEREITGISPTMLTSQLRELERDGLVSRTIFATVPPTVEYAITIMGHSTLPMLTEIYKWGEAHQAAELDKRRGETVVDIMHLPSLEPKIER